MGEALDLESLSFPMLNPIRTTVAKALAKTSSQSDALAKLGVGKSLADAVAANRHWQELATLAVSELYNGVLYDALDFPSLDPSLQQRATRQLMVSSALWGVLRWNDQVPWYRLSMSGDIGLGPLATMWRKHLTPMMDQLIQDDGLLIDCRSSTYAASYVPSKAVAEQVVTVSAVKESQRVGSDGKTVVKRQVISHMAKHTRGLVTRWLIESSACAQDPEQAAKICQQAAPKGWSIELEPPLRPGKTWTMTVVQPEAAPLQH